MPLLAAFSFSKHPWRIKVIGKMVACKYCSAPCIKHGCQKNGQQRLRCKKMSSDTASTYSKQAYGFFDINKWSVCLVKESCGIRSMARLLSVSVNTVMKRIRQIAAIVKKPTVVMNQEEVEVDELRTYVGNKRSEC